jgi:DNA-binding CsgD family transcriptional regulator
MINNLYKSTNYLQLDQIVAGVMPNDSNIEFIGVKKTKQVLWLQNGSNHYFCDLPTPYLQLIKDEYLKWPKAVAFLNTITNSFPRQLELFTYYMFGSLDTTPDIANGKLSLSENFRDSKNCPSLLWNCKKISIDGYALSHRELVITDMFFDDVPDKTIARLLHISESYLNDIKNKMYRNTGVQTKVAYMRKAVQQQVV